MGFPPLAPSQNQLQTRVPRCTFAGRSPAAAKRGNQASPG